jgi:hypothetical protein
MLWTQSPAVAVQQSLSTTHDPPTCLQLCSMHWRLDVAPAGGEPVTKTIAWAHPLAALPST